MSKRPWMPLYVADYLADTEHLRAAESGAYMHLIMHYWRHGGLPNDDRLLSTIARMTPEEWASARPLLQPLFKAGLWKHKRIEAELAKTAARISAGQKGGKAKAEGKQTSSKSLANAKQNPSDPPSTPVVVSYDTTTLSPKEEDSSSRDLFEKESSGIARARDRKARATATRLPPDWQPSLDDLAKARELLPENQIQFQIEKFRDYWRARAGPGAVKLDWSATWRNWCRTESQGGRNGQHRNSGRAGAPAGGESHAILAVQAARRAAAAFGQDD